MIQVFVNGIISGLTISLLALAFTSVYLPTRVFHVALGGIYSIVPFIVWASLQKGYSWYFAVLMGVIVSIVLSIACELLNHSPLENKGASQGAHLVSSLGLYIIIVQIIALIWGSQSRMLRTGLDSFMTVGGLALTRSQIMAALGSAIIITVFFVWLQQSRLGLQFRALADNPVEFALRGYNVPSLRLVAFGIAGLLCSVSSLLVSYDLGFDPNGGLNNLMLAVVAVIIGGRESFLGPVLGGILIGIVRSEVVWFLSANWQDAVTFFLLATFLLISPNGLLGYKGRLEANI